MTLLSTQDLARNQCKTQQFFTFPPFSSSASHMTTKRRVFVAIMEGKFAVRVRVRGWG